MPPVCRAVFAKLASMHDDYQQQWAAFAQSPELPRLLAFLKEQAETHLDGEAAEWTLRDFGGGFVAPFISAEAMCTVPPLVGAAASPAYVGSSETEQRERASKSPPAARHRPLSICMGPRLALQQVLGRH